MSDAARYPEELSHTVTTTDGTPVFIRAVRPEDAQRLIAFYGRLSEHTAYQRFFTVMKRLPPDWARRLANVDYATRLAIVAEAMTASGRELVAVAPAPLCSMICRVPPRLAASIASRLMCWRRTDACSIDLISRFTTVVERELDHGVDEATFTAEPLDRFTRR